MGMSTSVTGYIEPGEDWMKMLAVWDACAKAGVRPPDSVYSFFDGEYPGDKPGKEVKINVTEHHRDSSEIYQVEIAQLPKNVTHIRFTNSY